MTNVSMLALAAAAIGTNEAALRLLVVILLGVPLSAIYNISFAHHSVVLKVRGARRQTLTATTTKPCDHFINKYSCSSFFNSLHLPYTSSFSPTFSSPVFPTFISTHSFLSLVYLSPILVLVRFTELCSPCLNGDEQPCIHIYIYIYTCTYIHTHT